MKKALIGVGIVVLLLVAVGFFWVRSVFGGDAVRLAIAGQLTAAIGQPVTIGSIGASAYPRVTVDLVDVRIGEKGAIQLGQLQIATSFGALLSRRIEHATLRLKGASIALPLPPFPGLASAAPGAPSGSPVELVSIDDIVLSDVQITSGGRALHGDIELVPEGTTGVEIRKIALVADDSTITATGRITNIAGPVGEIHLASNNLRIDRLMAFVDSFSAGSGMTGSPNASPARSQTRGTPGMDLTVTLAADRATMGELALEKLTGRARISDEALTLDPVSFGVFGGKYDGTLALSLGARSDVRAHAKLTGVDVAAAARFAGSPDTVSGRMAGTLDVVARGTDAATLTEGAKGRLRVDVTDGVIRNLGLVHAVVVATSMRSGAAQNATAGGSKDEPFSKLGATLVLADGVATTNDLSFVSKDLQLAAGGSMKLSAATVDLKGRVQLSDELSKQAGQDLVRYTQEQGRVTFPATITGPSSAPSVRIDVGDMAKRAATNAANEEAQKHLKGGLSRLFKK